MPKGAEKILGRAGRLPRTRDFEFATHDFNRRVRAGTVGEQFPAHKEGNTNECAS
jgi:hypothetical protein